MTQDKVDSSASLPLHQNTQTQQDADIKTSDTPDEQSISGGLSRQQMLMIAGILGAFVLLTLPILRWLWAEWMTNEYYSHGVLIAPAALYLGWRRLVVDPKSRIEWFRQDMRGVILLAVSLLLYLFWMNGKAYYLASFAVIGAIAGMCWVILGWQAFRRLIFPLAFLVLMIPLPIIERSTYPLAMFTGVCSGALVRFFGLPIHIVGNAVEMPGTDLLIGAQCSGVNSMITLFALTSLCAYLFNGPMWGRLGLVLLSIPLAMAGNILRVGNLLYIAYYWGVDAAFTFYHDYSGIFFFVIVFALLFPLMKLLRMRTVRMDVI